MSSHHRGTLLILDNNSFGLLEPRSAYNRFLANVRAANLIPQLTEANLLEATATGNDAIRGRLYDIIKRFPSSRAMLGWPLKQLQKIGEAIVTGTRFEAEGLDAMEFLDDEARAKQLSSESLKFQRGLEEEFSSWHGRARQGVQRALKEREVTHDFESAADFLDRYWVTSPMRRDIAETMWRRFHLRDPAPYDRLNQIQPWSILLDAHGAAVYERTILTEQPKPVTQWMDLLQLVYMGGADLRVLATQDRGLRRVGDAVLRRRYANARVVAVTDLVN